MKFLTIFTVFTASLFAQSLPTISPEDKLRIREAQMKVMAASEAVKTEQLKLTQTEQYLAVNTAIKTTAAAQGELNSVVGEIVKKHKIDTTKTQLTADLKFEPIPEKESPKK